MNCQAAQAVLYFIVGYQPLPDGSVSSRMKPQLCSGLSGVWLMQAYINAVLVLILPAACIYKLEQQAKHRYLKKKGLVAQWAGEGVFWPAFGHLQALLCMVLLAMLWQALELICFMFQPSLRC